MAAPRILIVEDEFLVRLTLAEALRDDGFEVVETDTAGEAMAALRDDPGITLMLTDLMLGGRTDGRALASEARLQLPDLPVLFTTGRPDALAALAGLARTRVVAKPYQAAEITRAIRLLLEIPEPG